MDVENIGQATGNGDASSDSQAGDKPIDVPSGESPKEQNSHKEGVGTNSVATAAAVNSDKEVKSNIEMVAAAATSDQEVKSDKDSYVKSDEDVNSDKGRAAAAVKEEGAESLPSSPEEEDEWLDLLSNGKLKMKVVKAGQETSRPPEGSLVTVSMKGWLMDGTLVMDSVETFILGDGDIITALDLCVALMNTGEVADVYTDHRFAFGKVGRQPDIHPFANLNLQLNLMEVRSGPDLAKMTAEERLDFGEKKRERGNQLFARGDYSVCINVYSKAIKILEAGREGLSGDTSVLQKILDSRLHCYNNMALSQLKLKAYDAAIRSCEEVFKIQPKNAKALYRQGKAYSGKGDLKKAIHLMQKSLETDPEAKVVHKEIAQLKSRMKDAIQSEKAMYKKMFGFMASDSAAAKNSGASSNASSSTMKWALVVGGLFATGLSIGAAYYRATH